MGMAKWSKFLQGSITKVTQVFESAAYFLVDIRLDALTQLISLYIYNYFN